MKTQILELEKKYWQGMEDHDYEAVKNLTYFPCIVAGKNGVRSVDETTFKKMFDSGAGVKYKVLNITGVETQAINDNTVVIGYLIDVSAGDGQEPLHCACTSTWLKQNDNWVCAMHSESELVPQEEHQPA